MSEMETSSLVGVEQAFFLPLLVFSGVFFSSEALTLLRYQITRRREKFWPHLTGLDVLSFRDLEDLVAVMYLDDTLLEGRVRFFID